MTKGDGVIELTNVTISQLTVQIGRDIFGQGNSLNTFSQNVPKLTINEDYIISVQAS